MYIKYKIGYGPISDEIIEVSSITSSTFNGCSYLKIESSSGEIYEATKIITLKDSIVAYLPENF